MRGAATAFDSTKEESSEYAEVDAEEPTDGARSPIALIGDQRDVGRRLSIEMVPTHETVSISPEIPLSPRRLRKQSRDARKLRLEYVISSPIPYVIIVLLILMVSFPL